MYKKVFILLLILILLIFNTLTIIASPNSTEKFPDVKVSDWYYNNLKVLSPLKIIQGNDKGYFMPQDTVRYNQFLKMVDVALTNQT